MIEHVPGRSHNWVWAGLAAGASVAIVCGWLAYARWHPEAWVPYVHSSAIQEGQRIIRAVEVFRSRTGALPAGPKELGIPEDRPPYHERLSADRYIVYFGYVLGESYTYDSADRKREARVVVRGTGD